MTNLDDHIATYIADLLNEPGLNNLLHIATCRALDYAEDAPDLDDDDLYWAERTNMSNRQLASIIKDSYYPRRSA